MTVVVGSVSKSIGRVTAVGLDEKKRELGVGSKIFEGDLLFADGVGSSADIIFNNDNSISLNGGETVFIDETVYRLELFDNLKVVVDLNGVDNISDEVTDANGTVEPEIVESQVDEASIAERIDFGAQLASKNNKDHAHLASDTSSDSKDSVKHGSDVTTFEEAAAKAQVEPPSDEPDDIDNGDTDVPNGSKEDSIDNDLGIPVNHVNESLDLELLEENQNSGIENNLNGLNIGDVMQSSKEDSSLDIIDKDIHTGTQSVDQSLVDEVDSYSVYTDDSAGDEFDVPIDEIAALGLGN